MYSVYCIVVLLTHFAHNPSKYVSWYILCSVRITSVEKIVCEIFKIVCEILKIVCETLKIVCD